MEWEVYYEDYLMFKKMNTNEDTAYHQAAAIVGQDGKVGPRPPTSLRLGFSVLQLTTEERIAIMREFDEPGTLTTYGLYLSSTKYVVIGVEPGDVIRAKKWPEWVTIKKTSAALVIGMYHSTAASNMCNAIVERVGEDLIKRGY